MVYEESMSIWKHVDSDVWWNECMEACGYGCMRVCVHVDMGAWSGDGSLVTVPAIPLRPGHGCWQGPGTWLHGWEEADTVQCGPSKHTCRYTHTHTTKV